MRLSPIHAPILATTRAPLISSLTYRKPRTAIQIGTFSHMTEDLVASINNKAFTKWDLYIQTIKASDLDKFDFNPLDATKIWPGITEVKVGQMEMWAASKPWPLS